MELMLERLSESVASAESLEQLARPLLEMLELISGLESLYLTSIDEEAGVQCVDYARNAGELFIPEGLTVPWSDTLCKRCLEEGRRFKLRGISGSRHMSVRPFAPAMAR
jgi:diguanylate cyclase